MIAPIHLKVMANLPVVAANPFGLVTIIQHLRKKSNYFSSVQLRKS
jgi:hypothetical protein